VVGLETSRDPLAAALAACRAAAAEPFDLAAGPLLRALLWPLGDPARHVLLIALHHIAGDAWSMDVLMRDLAALYEHRRRFGAALAPLARQAKDFAVHEQRLLAGEALAASRDYWLARLGGELPVLELPTDHPRPAWRGWQGHTLAATLAEPVASGLEALARAHGASLHVLLVALTKALLHRLTGQEDIILGAVVTGRDHAALDDQIGFYVETVALRDTVSRTEPFAALLARVRRTVDEAVAYRRYPFELIVQALDPPHDPSRNPLFDVMVVFDRAQEAVPSASGMRVSALPLIAAVSKLDLTFHFRRDASGLGVALEYRTDLFAEARMRRLLGHVGTLAASLLSGGAATPVGRLDLIGAEERARLAAFADGGTLAVPAGRMHELFAAEVLAGPDRPAVVTPSGTLRYRDLNRLADAVADLLRGPGGLVPGEAVLVVLDRSAHLVAALLGILKAGGIYMPADRQHPAQRIAAMLSASRCRLAIAEAAPPGMMPLAERDGLSLFAATGDGEPIAAADAAYLIFTSGSTGAPKGVLLGHRGFVNMIARQIEAFGVAASDRVLLFASPAFDASLSELFMALLAGAAVVPADARTVADAQAFPAFLARFGVTVATLPPAYLAALGRPDLGKLRVLVTAGEPPVAADVRHCARSLRTFNAYGPTETSVCATIWEVPQAGPPDADLPIGRPLANTSVHVLDAGLEPVPLGVAGEICIGGAGLALGYLGDAAATERAFVQWRGERLYRTGDRGTWRGDGLLVYGGRLDQQVKIRGQRIEPAEVERALAALPEVAQALVAPRGEGPAGRHLVAWLLRRAGATPPSAASVRARLAETLPPAMVPAHIVWVAAFPRTVNGKIDRRALPEPDPEAAEAIEAPRNAAEAVLAEVFALVLGRQRIGIHSPFFELGGDSIKLLQVAAELGRRGLRIDIAEVYRHPTVAALAAGLGTTGPAIDQRMVTGPAPLSASQAWFFRTFRGNPNHFNQSVLLSARGRLDPAALQAALAELLRHHDALRLRFASHDGRMRQEFGGLPSRPVAEIVDLRDAAEPEAAMEGQAQAVQRSLDLAAGRVVAAALFRLPEGDRLLLVAHHLVVDAVSWRILLDDLCAALAALGEGRAPVLPPKTHSFGEWAEHQARVAASPALVGERAHWESVCAGQLAVATGKLRRRRSVAVALRDDPVARLLAQGASVEPALLTAFAVALAAEFGGGPVVVTLEGHGREAIVDGLDVGRTVGWFTSFYPVRLALDGRCGAAALAEVERALAAVPNRGLGFGILAELAPEGEAGPRLPAGGIGFNYLGRIEAPAAAGPFEPGLASLGDPVDPDASSPFALDLLASVQADALHLLLSHDPDALAPQAGRRLMDAIVRALAVLQTEASGLARPAPRLVRPYIRRIAEDLPLVLNAGERRKLFAMPPLFGYGAAFRSLGERLPGVAFHAFDFIEGEDRIERYVRAIRSHAAGQPAVMLGYSGGGNLGFALARALTASGAPPSRLILLDAPLKRRVIEQDEAAIQDMMTSNLAYFRDRMAADADYRAYVVQPELRAMMLRKMEAFIRYLNGHVDDGCIGADIHLLRSTQDWAEPEDWSGWAERTSGRFVVHQGAGDHAHMTEGCHLDANAAVIAGILETGPAP
jgi:amino acid adenylation domain-containing protein/non-ribosomal peptide synthase protein (TIGR01720 family)